MRQKTRFLIALIISFAVSFSSVNAGQVACSIPDWPELETVDNARMARLEISRTKGLSAALRSSNQAERELVAALFESGFEKIQTPEQVIGKYRCRTIKLGGLNALTVYSWFRCEINPEAAVMVIQKTTGSQNFFGVMVQAGNGLSYSGALRYGYEDIAKLYGEDAERNQVGCFSAIDKSMNRFVLELPEPKFESVHDVILFERID